MSTGTWILLVAALGVPLLIVVGASRMVWRMVRDNEEPEPGGSLSRQMTRRYKDPEPPEEE